jgi:glutathione synthase/RimK-type ligase-like ATP-grasp enzyme
MIRLEKDGEVQSMKPEIKVVPMPFEKQALWNHLLPVCFGDPPQFGGGAFAASSVLFSPEYNRQMIRLCSVLNKACRAIVLNYFTDERIRKNYQLDRELDALLKKANQQSYRQGFYRPDFLYDSEGYPKICEIGARYPFNGWMLSYYLRLMDVELGGTGSDLSGEGLNLQHLIQHLYEEWAPHGKVALVHDDEKGTEVFYIQKELAKRGLEIISVKPQELTLVNNSIHAGAQSFSQFILEMDREELKKISPDVMNKLIEDNTYLNDIRTLILIHDKRVLSVMYDGEIMRDYLDGVDYDFLQHHLIPSFVITNPGDCDAFIDTDQNLILKLNSGGRGIGACIKSDYTIEEWAKIVREHWGKYLIQHFVDQMEFQDEEHKRRIHLVGMLLCRDGETYGSGIFRGSDESVINVHQGRALIYSALNQ